MIKGNGQGDVKAGEPDQGASVAFVAVAVGLLDAALEGEDMVMRDVVTS
jgi:hypothetical protein